MDASKAKAANDENRAEEAEAPERAVGENENLEESANDGHIDPDILMGRTTSDTLLERDDLSKDLGSGSTGVGQEYFGGTNAPEAREERDQEARGDGTRQDADR